ASNYRRRRAARDPRLYWPGDSSAPYLRDGAGRPAVGTGDFGLQRCQREDLSPRQRRLRCPALDDQYRKPVRRGDPGAAPPRGQLSAGCAGTGQWGSRGRTARGGDTVGIGGRLLRLGTRVAAPRRDGLLPPPLGAGRRDTVTIEPI